MTGPKPNISAIVCTHNRALLLDRALACLADQTLPSEAYEVIVVDNASSDNTREIAKDWIRRCSNFRYVYEDKLGLSHARNRGMHEARAPIVAYIDDDAFAHREWLEELLAGFAQAPRPACVGGKIVLAWEGEKPPSWATGRLLEAYGSLDLGQYPSFMLHANGGNMALQKSVLNQFGGFQSGLGRRGKSLLAGEESDLQLGFREAGFLIRYQPKAVVEHWVPYSRQKLSYILKVYYNYGITESIRRRSHRTVSRLESMKLIVRALGRALRDTRELLMAKQHNYKGRLVLWLCLMLQQAAFVLREFRMILS